MCAFSCEQELIVPVSLYFYRHGGIILREVRLGFCRADLVVFTPDDTVIAVELKLSDWKKAFIQAQNYQLGSDYVYVAFPEKKRSLLEKKVVLMLKKKGIGLLIVDSLTHQVSEAIGPKRSEIRFGTISLQELKRRRQAEIRPYHLF